MQVKAFEMDKHFDMIKGWWEKRNFPPANPEFLSPHGFVVYEEEKPICAGFLISTNANAAIMTNLVSNPEIPGEVRHVCMDHMMETIIEVARGWGFGMLCCSTNLTGFMKRYEKHGFVKTDENISSFGRVL